MPRGRTSGPCHRATLGRVSPLPDELPASFKVFHLAALLGWNRRRTLRLVQDLGLARKDGGRWTVRTADLASVEPWFFEVLAGEWRRRREGLDGGELATGEPPSAP